MEYEFLKPFGNKNLKVTLKDGKVVKGFFLSYLTNSSNRNIVERITLAENEEISMAFTNTIESIDLNDEGLNNNISQC